MPDVHTQTWLTGNRIETVWKEHRNLNHQRYVRRYKKKMCANKRIVGHIGKSIAEHIVGADNTSNVAASPNIGGQKTLMQAWKKARATSASASVSISVDKGKVDVMGKVEVMGCEIID